MSKTWGWMLVAVWLLTLFGEIMPFSWRAAVLVVPVSITLIGLLHFSRDGDLWRPPGFGALVGWLILLLIQLVPLPPTILAFMSPGAYHLYSETVWVLHPNAWMPLALTAKPAFLWLLQYMVMAGVFYVTAQADGYRAGLEKLLQWFGLAVGLVALTIIGVQGFRVAGGGSADLFHTAFRGIMVSLAALVPLVLTCHLYAKPHRNYGKWTRRLSQALRHPINHLHGYLLVSAVLMCFAVILFGPPQIQVSLACGLLITVVMLLFRHTSRSGSMTTVALSLLVLVVIGLGTRHIIHRDMVNASAPSFTFLDRQTLVKDFILLGAGPGNLSDLEKRYTMVTGSPAGEKNRGFGFAVLSEGGLAGAVLTVCFWMAVLIAGVAGWLRRRNRMSLYLLPGVFGGLVVCFAAGPDPLQPSALWPGLTGYFFAALLVAIGCFSSSGEPDSVMGYLSPRVRWVMIFFAFFIGVAGVLYVGGNAWLKLSQRLRAAVTIAGTTEASSESLSVLEKRLLFDPLEANHWFAMGNYWASQRDEGRALAFISRALKLYPLAGEPLYRVGVLLEGRGYVEEGLKLLQAGMKNAPLSPTMQRDHLVYLLSKGDDRQAMEALSRLLLIDPDETGFWLRYFEKKNISKERWRRYLPRRAEVYRQFGDYLAARAQGNANGAGAAYMQSVRLAVSEPWVSTELFQQIAAYFIGKEEFDAALEVLRLGMEARPKDLSLLLTAGSLYSRLGITYRAEEIYRKALLLDPDNSEVRSMLESL